MNWREKLSKIKVGDYIIVKQGKDNSGWIETHIGKKCKVLAVSSKSPEYKVTSAPFRLLKDEVKKVFK